MAHPLKKRPPSWAGLFSLTGLYFVLVDSFFSMVYFLETKRPPRTDILEGLVPEPLRDSQQTFVEDKIALSFLSVKKSPAINLSSGA